MTSFKVITLLNPIETGALDDHEVVSQFELLNDTSWKITSATLTAGPAVTLEGVNDQNAGLFELDKDKDH